MADHETPAPPVESIPPDAVPPPEGADPVITPAPVPGLPLSDATIEAAPESPAPRAPKGVKYVEPKVGQRARIFVPERKTAGGRPIPVLRPGTPTRPYETDEIVRWDNYLVNLRSEGAVLATEIVE